MAKHVFTNGTATVTEASTEINVADIYLIANDATTGDLYVGLDSSPSTDTNYMIVKPGETFKNLETPCKTVYVKSSTGSVVYRVYGKKF